MTKEQVAERGINNKRQIIDMAKSGMARKDIAKQLGFSYAYVFETCKTNGVECAVEERKEHKAHVEKIRVISEMRASGKTYTEISKLTGLKKSCVHYICAEIGANGYINGRFNEERKVSEVIDRAGYDYIGGFIDVHHNVTVQCRVCGGRFDRLYHIFSDYVNGTTAACGCPMCRQAEAERRKQERAEAKKQEAELRELEKEKLRAERERQEQIRKTRIDSKSIERLMQVRTCKECGKEYCIASAPTSTETYCSKACGNRLYSRNEETRRRHDAFGREHDTDISLHELFKRDKGICYLCGNACEWDDYDTRGDIFIAGNKYPSIDHVIPLSKGGLHKWSNVKLACRQCNSIKGAG